MPKKIFANVEVTKKTTSLGKNTINDVNGVQADSSGNVNYPFYKKDYINKVLKVLPVSRVGTMDYLPLNMSGSFEGATTYFDQKHVYPIILENDGTLVYLRPGTNGSTDGYYYCYVENARNATDLTPVLTNEKYIPTFFTASHKLLDFIGTKASELLFMLTNNGTNDTYTIALTNKTMNRVSHQYLEFNRTLIPNTNPQYAHIVGTLVYIWCVDSYVGTDPLSISLYTITVDGIKNGSTSTLQRVTGFSGSTITGAAVSSSNNIRLAQSLMTTSSSTNPLFLIDSNVNVDPYVFNHDGLIQAVSNPGGTSVRVNISHSYGISSSLQTTPQRYWGLSFTYNISTKVYALDSALGSITITSSPSIVINDPYNVKMENITGFPTSSQGNVPTIFQTQDGVVFSAIARYITSGQHKLVRSNIQNYTDAYTSLNLSTRALNSTNIKYVDPIYGSAIGENLINPVYTGSGVIINCSGTDSNGTFGFDSKVQTSIGSTPNYTYNSVITGGTITGYAPQTDRIKLDNTDNSFIGTICEIALNGSTKLSGSSFIEGFTKKSYSQYSPATKLWSSQEYSLSNTSILTNLKNSILGSTTGYTGTITDSIIVLYYRNPTAGNSKSYACTTFITSDNSAYCVISEISTGLASTYVINSLISTSNRLVKITSQAISIDYSYISRMSGMILAEYDTFYYLGISALINIGTSSNATFRGFVFKVSKSTGLITDNFRTITEQYVSAASSYTSGAIPGVGFGLYENGSITDYQTKLVFNNHGTTEAALDALIAGTGTPTSKIVIAAQDVAQGFVVYFTQELPVFMNGVRYDVPAKNIDLTTIKANPANSTFYVYVVENSGVCDYVISTTKLSEELNRIYIGTITTGATNITSIDSEKVTRFLTYRVSTTKRGSAIPTSTGVPSGTGTRWH